MNSKFDYRFKYNPNWMLNSNMPGSEENDRVVVQGDISEKGWPSIEINLLSIPSEPTTQGELRTYLEDTYGDGTAVSDVSIGESDTPALLVVFERSSQAYASENYYFFQDGDVLQLSFNDTESSASQTIYDCFLQNFEVF